MWWGSEVAYEREGVSSHCRHLFMMVKMKMKIVVSFFHLPVLLLHVVFPILRCSSGESSV